MSRMKHWVLLSMLLILILAVGQTHAQTGKIMGRVFVKGTGEALMGTNIIVVTTNMGAASDTEGYYVILNIPPGVYTIRGRMMGYATINLENVKVSINQTTILDIPMELEAVEGQTVTVTAERPAVQLDISSSQKIVTDAVIQDRPVDNLEEILAAEAGITLTASEDGSGLVIWGYTLPKLP